MKFRCGAWRDARRKRKHEKRIQKYEAWHEWHRAFAWLPIKVGHHDCRWLEYVEQRATYWAMEWNTESKEYDVAAISPEEYASIIWHDNWTDGIEWEHRAL